MFIINFKSTKLSFHWPYSQNRFVSLRNIHVHRGVTIHRSIDTVRYFCSVRCSIQNFGSVQKKKERDRRYFYLQKKKQTVDKAVFVEGGEENNNDFKIREPPASFRSGIWKHFGFRVYVQQCFRLASAIGR